jgi:hypothetical protein
MMTPSTTFNPPADLKRRSIGFSIDYFSTKQFIYMSKILKSQGKLISSYFLITGWAEQRVNT